MQDLMRVQELTGSWYTSRLQVRALNTENNNKGLIGSGSYPTHWVHPRKRQYNHTDRVRALPHSLGQPHTYM